jgi:hypothetical protein
MSKVNDALVNAETLGTALGTDGTTVTDSATSALGAVGANNNNNAFSSSSVVANEDGSVLERLEQILEATNKGSGTALAANKSIVDALGTNGTTLVDDAGSIVGILGVDDANNAFASTSVVADEDGSILERLEQIQEAVNKGTGTPMAANKAIADALGTDGTTVTDSAVSVLGAIGANNANNAFASNSVVANVDGSVLERQEAVQAVVGALTDAADETAATATIMNLLRGILARNIAKEVYKTVAFDGGAGSGGIGTVALFTVTGAVKIKITAICTETLVGAATLECGYAGTTNGIIAQIANATALIAGEIWYDATPTTVVDTVANGELQFILGNGQDLYLTVGAANITDGTITFKIVWEPLTSNGAVVAA